MSRRPMHPAATATAAPIPGAAPGADDLTRAWRAHAAIGGVLLLGLAAAGVQHADRLNSDGVAYIRLAEYWARGEWNLAVSGYWGPLLSWLMAPFLKGGLSPITAARVAMAISGFVFWIGATTLLAATGADFKTRMVGACVCAAAAVCWSVDQISPDLLLAGLICLALRAACACSSNTVAYPPTSRSSIENRREGPRAAGEEVLQVHPRGSHAQFPLRFLRPASPVANGMVVGLWWGLAYLTKAVALPVGAATLMLGGALHCLTAGSTRSQVLRHTASATLALLLLSLPWILILSARYDRPTFSTSARIAHAVVGPDDQPRSHPFARTFHHPEPGRITNWEDPSRDAYNYWSPLDNDASFRHQLRLIAANLWTLAGLIGHFDVLYVTGLGLAVLLVGKRRGDAHAASLLVAVGLPLALLVGAYVPVYVKLVDERYLYAALPLGFAITAGAQRIATRLGWLPETLQPGRILGISALGFSFLLAAAPRLPAALTATTDLASLVAADLATRLRTAQVAGPIAGSALIQGQRTGLFVAFRLESPWLGDRPDADADAVAASGTAVYLVHRGSPTALRLREDPRFRSLDRRLFAPGEEATAYPLEVFVVESGAGSPATPSADNKALNSTP